MSTYPPVAFPPPPPTSNTLTSQQRAALIRSSKKLSKVLGDVPRVVDDDIPPIPSLSPSALELTRTRTRTLSTTSFVPCDTESTWRKRKPSHLPPLFKLPSTSIDAPDSPTSLTSHCPPTRQGSVLSVASSIVSNAPSTVSASSFPDVPPADATQRRAKLERLRRKLGSEVPATAVFPTTPRTAVDLAPHVPHTPKTPKPHARHACTRSRSVARHPSQADDTRSLAFSISSDESVHTVTFTAARVRSPTRPHKMKHVYQTGPLPPVPPIPTHLVSASTSSSHLDDDDAGLIRPRQKMAAGSRIGGSDFKAARRAKREGRALHGMAEPGEIVEMVGFGW